MNPHLQEKDDHLHLQVQASPYSPSFSTYTTNPQIADIASRVVALDLNEPRFDYLEDGNDAFEFGFAGDMNPDSFPVYPVFNRDLMRDLGSKVTSPAKTIELRSLFFEEDSKGYDQPARLSSSEPEFDGVEPETYCLWAPKSPSPSPSRCMKSSSTGSGLPPVVSKTWRLRSLLRRCKSDGKEGLLLVSNNNGTKKNSKENKISKEKSSSSSWLSPPPSSPGCGVSSGGRRKSYLPYKPDLLGFFGSPQTLRRINIPPF